MGRRVDKTGGRRVGERERRWRHLEEFIDINILPTCGMKFTKWDRFKLSYCLLLLSSHFCHLLPTKRYQKQNAQTLFQILKVAKFHTSDQINYHKNA